jgi:hypothetical protein
MVQQNASSHEAQTGVPPTPKPTGGVRSCSNMHNIQQSRTKLATTVFNIMQSYRISHPVHYVSPDDFIPVGCTLVTTFKQRNVWHRISTSTPYRWYNHYLSCMHLPAAEQIFSTLKWGRIFLRRFEKCLIIYALARLRTNILHTQIGTDISATVWEMSAGWEESWFPAKFMRLTTAKRIWEQSSVHWIKTRRFRIFYSNARPAPFVDPRSREIS